MVAVMGRRRSRVVATGRLLEIRAGPLREDSGQGMMSRFETSRTKAETGALQWLAPSWLEKALHVSKPQIFVYPCTSLTASPQTVKAAGAALFGRNTAVFPGGWRHYHENLVRKAVIAPPVVATADLAEAHALQFMARANERWRNAGQDSDLFPTAPHFRLVKQEVAMLKAGSRHLAWRLHWVIFAQSGPGAVLPPDHAGDWAPVEHASVVLIVSLAGVVLGGSAHWRPTGVAIAADQVQTPLGLLEHLRAAAGAREAAPHHDPVKAPAAAVDMPLVSMHYSGGTRSEFRNFLDPRLRFHEGIGNSHRPDLVVPMTDYGLSAELVSTARRSGTGTTATGEVTLHPWVVSCRGTVSVGQPGVGVASYWTVTSLADPGDAVPARIPGGSPLRLQGLYDVAFTVRNDRGCIAHAHAAVASAIDPSADATNLT